jgi:hypothetical protein
MEFPTTEYRLLGLFRFWNIINYFYPYKNLIDEPWDVILPRFIVRFETNKDAAAYQLTAREMVAQLRDSHGAARSASRKGAERLGQFYPPFRVRFIEKQTVVTAAFDSAGLKTGDALLSVDDEPIEKRRERFAVYVSALSWRFAEPTEKLASSKSPERFRLMIRDCRPRKDPDRSLRCCQAVTVTWIWLDCSTPKYLRCSLRS